MLLAILDLVELLEAKNILFFDPTTPPPPLPPFSTFLLVHGVIQFESC